MRRFFVAAAMAAALAVPAHAQYDGPLAAPDAAAAAPTPSLHHAKPKAKRVHHAAAKPVTADDAFAVPGAPPREAAPPAPKAAADDPLSLGMKWNGNSDSVSQTRSQNLDGSAYGSGAEVGMKLHF